MVILYTCMFQLPLWSPWMLLITLHWDLLLMIKYKTHLYGLHATVGWPCLCKASLTQGFIHLLALAGFLRPYITLVQSFNVEPHWTHSNERTVNPVFVIVHLQFKFFISSCLTSSCSSFSSLIHFSFKCLYLFLMFYWFTNLAYYYCRHL